MRGCVVVGCGPAALGLTVGADRLDRLPRLLADGLLHLERSPDPAALRRRRFPYQVESNSTAADFLSTIRPGGAFGAVLDRPAAARLRSAGAAPVPLPLVAELMNDLTDALERLGPVVAYGADVATVRQVPHGWITLTADGDRLTTSRTVVLAAGAVEDPDVVARAYGLPAGSVLPSAAALGSGFPRVTQAALAGREVVVVGGSHSGFAVARLLLDRCGAALRPGQVTVVHARLGLAFDDVAAEAAWRQAVGRPPEGWTRPLVEPATGRVNRFCGLRGTARRLCDDVLMGREDRVRLRHRDTPGVAALVARAGLVVQAVGYRPVPVEVLDAAGRRLTPPPRGHVLAVDHRRRVVDRTGRPLPGVFGLGLGYGLVQEGRDQSIALNYFHGPDAEAIVSELAPARAAGRPGGEVRR